ncbi:hypothetical protein QQ045_003315 [Rhodiola kirilowii]
MADKGKETKTSSQFYGFGGNDATMFFLIFALLDGVVGVASKIVVGNHIRAWRNDSLSAAASSALFDWAITAFYDEHLLGLSKSRT